MEGFATHHDNRGVCWLLGRGRHSTGQLFITQLIHAIRKALHLTDRQQQGGMLGLDSEHLTLGVE